MVWESLRICYVAVALCAGVTNPGPVPKIDVKPGQDFPCGRLCYDPPASSTVPTLCDDMECASCLDVHTQWCAGDYARGIVTVSEGSLDAIPHEFLHRILQRSGKVKDGDPGHLGPWWDYCQHPDACAGLRGWPRKTQGGEVVR